MHALHHPSEGKSIVFLHGFGVNTRTWKRLISELSAGLDIWLVDLLGHGLSEAPHTQYSVKVYLEALTDFIVNNKIKYPIIFGHSYGGWVGILYSLSAKNTEKLVLEDAAGLKEFSDEMSHTMPKYKEEMRRHSLFLNAKKHVVDSSIAADDSGESLTKEKLSEFKVPTLILWGENDDVVRPIYGNLYHKYIKNSQLTVIKDAKHTPHYTNPKEVAGHLQDFIL